MTIRLEVGKKSSSAMAGPMLSPKITGAFALKTKSRQPSQESMDQALALYLRGMIPSRLDLRAALRELDFPLRVMVAEVQGISGADDAVAEQTKQCLAYFHELSGGQIATLYCGANQICLMLPEDSTPSSVASTFKKAARSLGEDVNIGSSGLVEKYEDLLGAYRDAYQVARLGLRLWGKPYNYCQDDLGCITALFEQGVLHQGAHKEAGRILEALAKPKNLLPTLKMLFACNMSPTGVARAGRVHRNTVIYRLEKIKHQTGLDPLDMNDATQLYLALAAQELTSAVSTTELVGGGATFQDKVVVELLNGSRLNDAKVRLGLSSVGVALPDDFTCFFFSTGNGQASRADQTSEAMHINLPGGRELIASALVGKQATKFAQDLCHGRPVVMLTSKQIKGQLRNLLPILMQSEMTAAQKWPAAKVVGAAQIGGLLALTDSRPLREYAYTWASGVIASLHTNKQLEKTATTLLDASLSMTLASQRLKVHRNTLIYRVGRIRHLTGYDLTKFEDAVQMRLAMLLSELT